MPVHERDLIRRWCAGTAEVGMRVVDAGVDDRDLDPFAADAQRARPCERRLHARDADDVLRMVDADSLDVDNTRDRAQFLDAILRMLSLMPLIALWNVLTTRPPAAARLPCTADCSTRRCALTAFFSRRVNRRPEASCVCATESPARTATTLTTVLSRTRGFTVVASGPETARVGIVS